MLGELQQVLTLAATGTGIYVAVNGLRSWKRELTGKRDIDLCQNVIESFYEAEQKIQELRSPFSYPELEAKNRPKQNPESDEEKRLRDTHYVPFARMDAQRDFWVSFSSRKYRMRALFGDDAVKPFNKIENALREFNAAAASRYQSIRGGQMRSSDNEEFERELMNAIWGTGGERDKIGTSVRQAIKDMEEICIPVARARSGFRPAHVLRWRKPKAA